MQNARVRQQPLLLPRVRLTVRLARPVVRALIICFSEGFLMPIFMWVVFRLGMCWRLTMLG